MSLLPSSPATSENNALTSPENLSGAATLAQRAAMALMPSLVVAGALHGQTTPSDENSTASSRQKLADVVVEEQQTPSVSSPKATAPLRDTPQTVTVINKEVFQQQGATTLRDVLRNTPGITFQAGEGGTPAGDQMTIRGFSARTDIFIDGVRDTGGYSRDAFNLEQVEVTKGPASTNSGRGSTGGSINLVSKTPQTSAFQSGTVGVGTDNYKRATLDVNQPYENAALPGTAFRLNAMWQDSDVAGRDVVENKSWAVAPTLAFGLGHPTRFTLSYLHMEQDNVPDYGIPWVPAAHVPLAAYANRAAPVKFSNYYGLKKRDFEDVHNDLATAQIDHDLSESFTLRNVTRFGRTYRDSIITSPRFVSNTTTDIRRNDWKSRDQEDSILANNTNLNGTLSTGKISHDLAAGLELSREEQINYTRAATGTQSPNTDLYRPNPDDPYTEAIARNGAYAEATAKSAGIYLFDTAKLSEHWQLTGGVRWDQFKAETQAVPATGAATVFKRTDESMSWKAGVVYKPQENGSIYAGYGTSFNPSAEGLALTAATAILEPEKSRNYEVGTKWDLFNRGLSVSAAIFRTEKTNARTPGVNPGDPATVLQGEQRVDGLEVGASGKITQRWSAFAGYAYMHSEIVRSNTAAEVERDLSLTPKHSLNLWTSYEVAHGLSVGAGAQYMDSVFRNAANSASVPAYWLYNAMASYDVNKHLTLRLNVYNLADKDYVDRSSGGHFIPGAKRSATLTANLSF